jgi:hypothetical protein
MAPFPNLSIGDTAGGFRMLQQFFDHVADTSGMVNFVIPAQMWVCCR